MSSAIALPAAPVIAPPNLHDLLGRYMPRTALGRLIKRVAPLLPRDDAMELLDTVMRSTVLQSALSLVYVRATVKTQESPCDHLLIPAGRRSASCVRCESRFDVEDHGVVSRKVITTAYVNLLVDDLVAAQAGHSAFEDHGFGTGITAAAITDTGLETEFTTQYAVDNTRPEGTQAEGSAANIYQSVATFSPDSGGTLAVTEHGLLNSPTVGGGTLMDRHVFSAVNVVAGSDSLQATYEMTASAGG